MVMIVKIYDPKIRHFAHQTLQSSTEFDEGVRRVRSGMYSDVVNYSLFT